MKTMSQHAKILKILRKNGAKGTPNHAFTRMYILDYTARISELRKEGHEVIAERQYIKGRATGVWLYRLAGQESKTTWFRRRST